MISICSMRWRKLWLKNIDYFYIFYNNYYGYCSACTSTNHAELPALSASNAIASSENNVVKILVLDSVAFQK